MFKKINTPKKASFYILIVLFSFITSQSQLLAQDSGEIKHSEWKTFERVDFTFEGKNAYVVIPSTPLPGNPWIWRARFPGWHTEADSILVENGFHLAFINTADYFGSPIAMDIWDEFYTYLLAEYQLNRKVSLMGVSRGGLFVYNWAIRNPTKVSSIYAEAPVLDFKSWPGGFGEGKGNPKAWKTLKNIYGFESDEEAKAYKNLPIHQAASIASYKIPVLHMIGLKDEVVPPEENTMILINNYIKAGGIATVVPCTQGEQKLNGHHFPIETPQTVADFIMYHAKPKPLLSSRPYHKQKGGLKNAQLIFEKEKKGNIAFLGGSITYNGGWRDSLMNYFEERFPETDFTFVNAGVPSMGTTSSAFRLEKDILSKGKFDLVFEEAAVNDGGKGKSNAEQLRALEGIIRHLRNSNPNMDIVMMHFVDPMKIENYNDGMEPVVITTHNKIASHYAIPTINLAKEVTDRLNNDEFTWKDDFKNLHPSPFGQGIYARSMIQFLDDAFSDELIATQKVEAHTFPELLDKNAYYNGKFIDISKAKYGKGWFVDENWNPNDGTGSRQNYINVPMLISEQPGKSLKIKFEGNAVGITVAAGRDAGIIEYRIDKGEWKKQDLFTKHSKNLHLPWYYTLASALENGKHELELRLIEDKNERSEGTACRIRYFYYN
ncbi:SGNH/GDSL hydrolase family protein [Portibacter lacus]|uniref:SGNH hydrolase-type esterase domain-containing protein n=1 Tax=Portibacter lacus TaxID=1099794 RepID=A0AA37WF43_9BACT|nr:GDSL-type esterase/lipase family protein [Portibacter lacus]GLR19496.1 hypothetical protein GCM10007940_41120 [Portibacter lacus]